MTRGARTKGRALPAAAARGPSDLEAGFATLWNLLARREPLPEREHAFHPERKWRFDFAWTHERVAVELEGITPGRGGRHQRVAGFTADCEKYNAAAALGWCVLRYTAKDLTSRPAQVIEQVLAALERRRACHEGGST